VKKKSFLGGEVRKYWGLGEIIANSEKRSCGGGVPRNVNAMVRKGGEPMGISREKI